MVHTQCGTPLYVAPEVHMGQPYATKVDVWQRLDGAEEAQCVSGEPRGTGSGSEGGTWRQTAHARCLKRG